MEWVTQSGDDDNTDGKISRLRLLWKKHVRPVVSRLSLCPKTTGLSLSLRSYQLKSEFVTS